MPTYVESDLLNNFEYAKAYIKSLLPQGYDWYIDICQRQKTPITKCDYRKIVTFSPKWLGQVNRKEIIENINKEIYG